MSNINSMKNMLNVLGREVSTLVGEDSCVEIINDVLIEQGINDEQKVIRAFVRCDSSPCLKYENWTEHDWHDKLIYELNESKMIDDDGTVLEVTGVGYDVVDVVEEKGRSEFVFEVYISGYKDRAVRIKIER